MLYVKNCRNCIKQVGHISAGVLHTKSDKLLTSAHLPAKLSLDVFLGLNLLKPALRRLQHHVADFTGEPQ